MTIQKLRAINIYYITNEGKATRNHPCEKFRQENYNIEDTIVGNGRPSESTLEEEEEG